MLGSSVLVRMLELHDVQHVFGLPGDTSVALYDALRGSKKLRHVMCRDERSSGYMADAYARLSGRPGVTDAPSGGGAAYLFPAVAESDGSSIPMIALTTDISLRSDNRSTLTAMDQVACYQHVTRFSSRLVRSDLIPHHVRMAFRAATGGRMGAAHLCLPEDVLSSEAGCLRGEMYGQPECGTYPAWRTRPPAIVIERILEALRNSQRPLILAGGGVLLSRAQEELRLLVERFDVGVVTSMDGKGAINEDHRLALGVIGGNGAKTASNRAVSECDMLIAIGTRLNSITTFGGRLLAHNPRLIHVDIDPQQLGCNGRADISAVGDARATLRDLIDCASDSKSGQTPWESWLAESRSSVAADMACSESLFTGAGHSLHPAQIMGVLKRVLPTDAVVVCDAGTPTPFASAYYPARAPRKTFLAARSHGSLGYAIPAALGARLACPASPVVALVGDGSLAMAMGELETLKRVGSGIVVLHMRNDTYGWIKMLQKLYFKERYFSVDFSPDTDYVGAARSIGLQSTGVSSLEQLERTLRDALDGGAVSFIEVQTASEVDVTPPVAAWELDEQVASEHRRRRSY